MLFQVTPLSQLSMEHEKTFNNKKDRLKAGIGELVLSAASKQKCKQWDEPYNHLEGATEVNRDEHTYETFELKTILYRLHTSDF